MVEQPISASGAVVFWTVSETDRDKLITHLGSLGLLSYMPKERTKVSALNAALTGYCQAQAKLDPEHEYRVQPLKQQSKHGLEVVQITPGEERNSYYPQFAVGWDDQGNLKLVHGYESLTDIRELYRAASNVLPGQSVGQALVRILRDHFQGTPLRPSGSVYWLPEDALEDWGHLAAAVQECSVKDPGNAIYRLRTVFDLEAVRAVRDAVSHEVDAAARKLAEEMDSGELGEEALSARKRHAQGLRERVSMYEGILGETLEQLRQAISDAEEAVCLASLSI